MYIPILNKHESLLDAGEKLKEECEEASEALDLYKVTGDALNRDSLAGEVLDVIQVCIGILDKLEKEGVDIERALVKHGMKLSNRQIWNIKKMIKIEVL